MVVFIRCNDIVSDSRAKKYIDFYDRHQIEYCIIAWDRLGNSQHLPRTIYCPYLSQYEQGGIRAIIDRIKWMSFILRTLFSFHQTLRIHACDLDAAFPAAVYRFLSFRKNFLIFDVFDWISDTLYNQGRIVSLAFAIMERFSTRQADHLIICEPERVRQIPFHIDGKYSVLQNIPSFTSSDFLYPDSRYNFDNALYTLSYVGGFTSDRCLRELVLGALEGAYNLNIAGYGWQELTQLLESHPNHPNIRYWGKVPYTEGLRIMFNSDLIYAMYAKVNPNHRFAAPNKYYEAMFVGKPLITTRGIIIADKVESNHIGFAIDESTDAIKQLVSQLSSAQLQTCASASAHLWEQYKSSTEQYLQTIYHPLIS